VTTSTSIPPLASLHPRPDPLRRAGPVVVAVGDADGAATIDAARHLPLAAERGVVAMAVIEPLPVFVPGSDLGLVPPGFEESRRSALLRELMDRVRAATGFDPTWRVQVEYGYPAITIADVARERDAPLIVMGMGRHGLMERLFGHETALRTMRRASCPVLAVAPGFVSPPRVAVLATDFSAESAAAAAAAYPLLADGATLHVVHAWQPAAPHDARLAPMDSAYARQLPERLRRFTAALTVPPGVRVTSESCRGDPAGAIVAFAEAHGADLVVAGRHGLNMLERVLVGSVTSALLRSSRCSLLVVPEPPFAEVDRIQRILTGTSEGRTPAQWRVQLDEFTVRNGGRRTAIEVDDPALGAQAQESGYALLGATYDPHDRRVELMLGDLRGGTRHLSRSIGDVHSITVATETGGTDLGLRIRHGVGQTLLTFLPG